MQSLNSRQQNKPEINPLRTEKLNEREMPNFPSLYVTMQREVTSENETEEHHHTISQKNYSIIILS